MSYRPFRVTPKPGPEVVTQESYEAAMAKRFGSPSVPTPMDEFPEPPNVHYPPEKLYGRDNERRIDNYRPYSQPLPTLAAVPFKEHAEGYRPFKMK